MIYGSLLAWRQSDLKAMVAYSSISHMGLVLLGIASLTPLGMTGAVLQMTAHGLIAGVLFLLVGLLYERTHTRNIQDYRSLIHVMPRFAVFMTLSLLAAMGLPSTVGFIAELQIFIGGFQQWGYWMVFFSICVLISAAYAIRTIGLLFTGTAKPSMQAIDDLRLPEMLAASVLVVSIILLGLAPTPLLDLSASTLKQIHSSYSKRFL
jgi:NADH-quinone oxidoreductase subunit M